MSLAIRLARGGMKKKPYYRIVVTDSRNARDGKFIEKIGTYNPLLNKENPERVKLDGERAAHWLGGRRTAVGPGRALPRRRRPAHPRGAVATRTRASPATRRRNAPTPPPPSRPSWTRPLRSRRRRRPPSPSQSS